MPVLAQHRQGEKNPTNYLPSRCTKNDSDIVQNSNTFTQNKITHRSMSCWIISFCSHSSTPSKMLHSKLILLEVFVLGQLKQRLLHHFLSCRTISQEVDNEFPAVLPLYTSPNVPQNRYLDQEYPGIVQTSSMLVFPFSHSEPSLSSPGYRFV